MTDTALYTVDKALELVKEKCKCEFDSTVEVHINLNLDTKKQDQPIRFTTTLPHGTGKDKKVAVFASQKVPTADIELSESDLDKIEKGELKPKVDFDVVISEPKFMAKIAKVAKILGPAGAMPNPKTGTVTDNVKSAVEQVKKGKIEIRTDPSAPIIHTIIGKRSFETKKLVENFDEVLGSLKQQKPSKAKPDWIKSIFVTTTMGPSVQIDVNTL